MTILVNNSISWSTTHSTAKISSTNCNEIFFLSYLFQIYIFISSLLTTPTFLLSISRAISSAIKFHSYASEPRLIFYYCPILLSPCLSTTLDEVLIQVIYSRFPNIGLIKNFSLRHILIYS